MNNISPMTSETAGQLREATRPLAVAKNAGIEMAEAWMLNQPQVQCVTNHHFGPGIYIRELCIPAGVCLMGAEHTEDHTFMLTQGRLLFVTATGVQPAAAPTIFISGKGRKMAYALDDVVCLTIHATSETDPNTIENLISVKSETYKAHKEAIKAFEEQYGK